MEILESITVLESTILNKIGLGSFDIGYLFIIVGILAVLVLILIILMIVQICKTGKLKKRLDKFLLERMASVLNRI